MLSTDHLAQQNDPNATGWQPQSTFARLAADRAATTNAAHSRRWIVTWLAALLLFIPALCPAESVRLTWDPSPDPEVTGYILWYGTQRGVYTNATAVGNQIVGTASNLVVGVTYYFVVTAHDAFGLESEPSNEVVYKVPLVIPEPNAGATQRGFVTTIDFGTLRKDFSGYVGMQFVVGAEPLTVKSLGRFKSAGNAGTHTMKLVRGSDGNDVPGGTVIVNMAGGVAGQFVYASLASPVVLNAGTTYYLVSLETKGADTWYSYDTAIATTSAASVRSALWGTGAGQWYAVGGAGFSYVPVDLQYATGTVDGGTGGTTNQPPTEVPYVTGVTPGTWRNNFSGFVGMNLVVGADPLTVTALGRMKVSGNIGAHLVKLVRAADGADVPGGAVMVGTSSGTVGQFQYGRLASPVVLEAGAQYYLMSQETAGGDGWFEYDTTVTTTGVARHQSAVWGAGPGQWYPLGGPGQTYVPVNFMHAVLDGSGPAVPESNSETAFLSGVTLGTLRNNYSGWAGHRFRVGSAPIEVRQLGRIYVNNNAQSHMLRLVRASDGVTLASATWTPAGGTHNQMKYVALAQPVVLAADTEYYLASQEAAGGDLFYSFNTAVTTTPAGMVQTPVYSDNGITWRPYGTAGGYSYGPVDFRYAASGCNEAGLVTGYTPGTLRNNYSGWVGVRLQTAANPVEVRGLGRLVLTNNGASHVVRLVRASDGATLGAVNWTPNGGTAGQFKYVALETPVTLAANTRYFLASQEILGGDTWYSFNSVVTTMPVATVETPVYSDNGSTWVPYGTPGTYGYGPVSLSYCAGAPDELISSPTAGAAAVDTAADAAVAASADTAVAASVDASGGEEETPATDPIATFSSASGAVVVDGYLVLQYLRSLPNPGVAYVIEASEDALNWSATDGLIEQQVVAVNSGIEFVQVRLLAPVTDTNLRYLRLRVISL